MNPINDEEMHFKLTDSNICLDIVIVYELAPDDETTGALQPACTG